MSAIYQSPGVYREEIFLKPSVPLASGIPGFVGFADAIATLLTLPTEILIPDNLRTRLRYLPGLQQLKLQGHMSAQVRTQLLDLATDITAPEQRLLYENAIQVLSERAQPIVEIKRREDIQEYFDLPSGGYLGAALTGFFENGGERCYIARADNAVNPPNVALEEALNTLASIDDIDLVAIPDIFTLRQANGSIHSIQVETLQHVLIQHCQDQQDRFALLDTLPDSTPAAAIEQQQAMTTGQATDSPLNAALYYPWIINDAGQTVPPCGHIAGIIAQVDRTSGIFKAPANTVIRDVQNLQTLITTAEQDQLNPSGINCIRAFPGRGIRLWGARTLSQNPTWRYINIRRFFLMVIRWIEYQMTWVTLEPNSPRLWIRIQRELTAYLTQLWRTGALRGNSPEEAFFVKCDDETNPPEQRELGQVRTELGLAVTAPSEFLIVRITQRPSVTEVS